MNGVSRLLPGWTGRERARRTLILLAVLLAALGSVLIGLASVSEELDVGLLLVVTVVGVLIGWLMAASWLPGWAAGILTFLIGVVITLVSVGYLTDELIALLGGVFSLPWQFLRWLFTGLPPDWVSALSALPRLGGEVEALAVRWGNWALAAIDGNPTYDPVSAALTWGIGLWPVIAWSGWRLRRHQPVLSLIPAGAVLVITLYQMQAGGFTVLLLLGATLILMALTWQDARERQWEEAGINFNRYIWEDLAGQAVTLSLVLVILAALMPTISVRSVSEFVERLVGAGEGGSGGPGIALGLGAQQPGPALAGIPFYDLRFEGLPRRHLLGSGPELSRQAVMLVRTDDVSELGEPLRRYYWRSVTYDQYDSRGWSTSAIEMAAYKAGEPAISAGIPSHRSVRQEVRVLSDRGGALHVAGTLVTVDRDYRVAWRSPGDAFGATSEAEVYQAESLVPVVSVEQLRSAGSDYPDWVLERYLALPDTVPQRVLSLAGDVTADAPTPYDKAHAIESYLREFPYTLDVPPPPLDQDVVDYFLFDLQQGYCDYYASAMVVLARAAGAPARLVGGYASGTYDDERARYVVTEADAHSWAEVYFPGYGWIEFEPTGGRAAIRRPSGPDASELAEMDQPLEPVESSELVDTGGSVSRWSWLLALPIGVAAAVAVGAAGLAIERWQLSRREPAAIAAMLYERLRRHGRRLAVPMLAGDTPYEFAHSFARHLSLARGGRRDKVLPLAVQDMRHLVEYYVQVTYSPDLPDEVDRVDLVRAWHRLRWRLWSARVWR